MENMQELNMDAMAQAVGGVQRTINTGIEGLNAAIRSGAGKTYRQIASLPNGTIVDTVSDKLVYDAESGRNFVEISYRDQNGKLRDGWVAASIVGLPR